MASIIAWFSRSGGGIYSDCTSTETCAQKGPQISIASNFAIVPGVILFMVCYFFRKQENDIYSQIFQKQNISVSDPVQIISPVNDDLTLTKVKIQIIDKE